MPHLNIDEKYQSLGGSGGILGKPSDPKKPCKDGIGQYRKYEHGVIFWHPNYGPFALHGEILRKWKDDDYERGILGYPISDETEWTANDLKSMLPPAELYSGWRSNEFPLGQWLQDTIINVNLKKIGRWSRFEKGCITWWEDTLRPSDRENDLIWIKEENGYTPANVSGIANKYQSLGGPEGFLSRPRDREGTCQDKRGKYRHFDKGSIFWHPARGAYEVHGGIFEKWKAKNYELGLLGYPVSDEMDWNKDDLQKMLPPEFVDWTNADISIGLWLRDKILNQNPTKIGRWSKFQHGLVTRLEHLQPPEQETSEWIWTKNGDFYVPLFESEKKKTRNRHSPSSISEKVRFWEEQDKINQALIPRIIELHEKVVTLSKHATNATEKLALTESRLTSRIEEKASEFKQTTAAVVGQLSSLDQELQKANSQIAAVERENQQAMATLSQQVTQKEQGLQLQVKAAEASINALEGKLTQTTAIIGQEIVLLKQEVTTASAQLGGIKRESETTKVGVASLRGDVQELASKKSQWLLYLALWISLIALIISGLSRYH